VVLYGEHDDCSKGVDCALEEAVRGVILGKGEGLELEFFLKYLKSLLF
jgi:hypothetical protein